MRCRSGLSNGRDLGDIGADIAERGPGEYREIVRMLQGSPGAVLIPDT
jgi:hypothetical protein